MVRFCGLMKVTVAVIGTHEGMEPVEAEVLEKETDLNNTCDRPAATATLVSFPYTSGDEHWTKRGSRIKPQIRVTKAYRWIPPGRPEPWAAEAECGGSRSDPGRLSIMKQVIPS